VVITGGNERTAVAVLALHAGDVVSADHLADALWGEVPSRSARSGVQSVVLRLRKQLGSAAIVTRPGRYELQADDEDIDVRRSERLVRDGRASVERGGVAAGIANFSEALTLWRGVALPELREWAPGRVEAERWEELRRRVEEELVELHLVAGHHHEVVPTAEKHVAEERLREQRWQQLMLVLYRCGRQAEA
jgi:DNA-binding SARP family transcriptional activator